MVYTSSPFLEPPRHSFSQILLKFFVHFPFKQEHNHTPVFTSIHGVHLYHVHITMSRPPRLWKFVFLSVFINRKDYVHTYSGDTHANLSRILANHLTNKKVNRRSGTNVPVRVGTGPDHLDPYPHG